MRTPSWFYPAILIALILGLIIKANSTPDTADQYQAEQYPTYYGK